LAGALICAGLTLLVSDARADCSASQGSPLLIETDGVVIDCDTSDPNPFTGGVGSQGTNTNLSVDIAADAGIDTGGDGVTLANGGDLDNGGAVTAGGNAVLGTDLGGEGAVAIDNSGSLTANDGAGIDLAAGLDNAVISNAGSVEATTFGIRFSRGELDNSGTIDVSGMDGIAVDAGEGSTLVNSGTITSAGTGVLDNSGSINNTGSIETSGTGLQLTASDFDNSGDIQASGESSTAIIASGATLINSGGIVAAGAGLELTAASTLDHSGSLDAANDAVSLRDGSSLVNTGAIASSAGAGISGLGGTTVTNAGTVSGFDAGIRLSGGGNTLVLQSGSDISGLVTAVITEGSGDSLVLEGQGSEDSDMQTFSSLAMRGTSWTLSGEVAAREAVIESGRLNIDGRLDTTGSTGGRGLVSIQGGTLGGQGVIDADVVNSAGTLVAGNPVGTLSIRGDYSQSSGGLMQVASNSSGQVSLLIIDGVADLAGTVSVSAGSDGIYDFLVADGGIEGEFDELLVEGRALVTLLASENTLSFIRASTTIEDNMVHAALDAAVLALDGLSLGGRHEGSSGIWLKPFGHYGERDEREGVPGSDFTIAGAMTGVDWRFGGGSFVAGAGVGYTTIDLDVDDGGDGEADNLVYGAYLEYAGDRFHGRLTLAGGSNEFEHSRSIFINDVRQRASADYDGDVLAARLSIGTRLPLRGDWGDFWAFEPELHADYLVIDFDPYLEQGGTGLEISSEDIEAAEFAGLLHVRRTAPDDQGIAARFHLGVVHRIAIDDREWTAEDRAAGARLLLPGDDEEITAFRFGFGADWSLGRHWQAALDYAGEAGDDADAHSLILGIKRSF
jgi:uncharacterized protein with beta-barrel porin domain